jgi:DNA-binding transcriptional LysR family regulator
MKLAAIDLNLLVVFDAVMQERSVTRAGDRLGLSQPAISHALMRLRHMLKDELFIRGPKGMIPTLRARQLASPVRQALDGLQNSLEQTEFDPSKATSSFRIAVDNHSARVLVGPIAMRLRKIAPGVTSEFRPTGMLSFNILDPLENGEIDLAIGPFAEQGARFSRQSLLKDDMVAVLRKNHPATRGELSIETFATLPHLEMSSVRLSSDFVDQALARRKLARRITLRAPFISAVDILVHSDMVAILPRRVAEELARYYPLAIRVLPHASPTIETAMIWLRRLDDQAAHRWLRETVVNVCKGLRTKETGLAARN